MLNAAAECLNRIPALYGHSSGGWINSRKEGGNPDGEGVDLITLPESEMPVCRHGMLASIVAVSGR